MRTASPRTQDLARRLVALEAASVDAQAVGGSGAVRVCEKIRVRLSVLVGVTGYSSLMSRAVAMAKAEVPSLDGVRVRPDGTLEGFDGVGRNEDGEAGQVVVAQLLALLVTFIGEPLALDFVRDGWPDAAVSKSGEEL